MGIAFSADEVFEMAMDIEKNGEAYYRKALALAKSARRQGGLRRSHGAGAAALRDLQGASRQAPAEDVAADRRRSRERGVSLPRRARQVAALQHRARGGSARGEGRGARSKRSGRRSSSRRTRSSSFRR